MTQPCPKAHSTIGVVTFNQPQQLPLFETLSYAAAAPIRSSDWLIAARSHDIFSLRTWKTSRAKSRRHSLLHHVLRARFGWQTTINRAPQSRRWLIGGSMSPFPGHAKSEVVIYSTLLPEQIDLALNSCRCVRDLKYYLEFAFQPARPSKLPNRLGAGQSLRDRCHPHIARPWLGCTSAGRMLGVLDRYGRGLTRELLAPHSGRH